MGSSLKNELLAFDGEGTKAAPIVPPERAKRLSIADMVGIAVAGIALVARAASGLGQTAWASVIGSTRDMVAKHESASGDNARYSLNLHHMLAMPDASLDALLAELAKVRATHGFGARQWLAAPEIVHTDEATRAKCLRREMFDVIRALDEDAPPEIVLREGGELIESVAELMASRQRAA
jgi:hypothetical protein